MIVVTGNGDLPLATQRRVERRASLLIDRPSPSLDRIYQLGLWLAIFFAIFLRLPPNKFLRIPPDVSPVSIRLALLFLLLFAQGTPASASKIVSRENYFEGDISKIQTPDKLTK